MRGGLAYLIMTLLLLSCEAGDDEKPKDEESTKKATPPEENKSSPPSPSEKKDENSPPPKEEEKQKKDNPEKEKGSGKKDSDKSSSTANSDVKPNKQKVEKESGNKQKEKKKTSDKDDSKPFKSFVDLDHVDPPATAQVEDNWLVSMMKMVDKKGMVTKLVTQVTFKPLPEDLTGKSEEDIMAYVDILSVERENIQERLLFGMGLKMFVGFVSYEYYNHGLLLSPLKYLADNDINMYASIDKQWGDHQERMANFVFELMKVRKVDVKTLPKSQLGIPLMKLKRAKDAVVSFPVWRTEGGAELPAEAKQITSNSKDMLLNFWLN